MSESSRTLNSIKNIIVGVGGYVLSVIFGFIGRLVFVRYLSAEYLGINGLFTNILTMLSLAELGIGSAIIYAIYKPLAEHDDDRVASLIKFYGKCYKYIGIIITIMGILLIPFLRYIVGETYTLNESIYLIYILYLFNTSSSYLFSYKISLLTADQKNYIVTGGSYIVTFITTIVQIIILILSRNYILYLIIQFINNLIYNILLSKLVDKMYPYINKPEIKDLDKSTLDKFKRDVKALVIVKISSLIVNNTDNIIISMFKGLTTVGLASNYTLFSGTLNSLLTQIFNGITASVGNYNALYDDEKNLELFKKINFLNFWLYGLCSVCFVILANDMIELFFGADYVLDFNISIAIGFNLYILGMQNASWIYKSTLGLFNYGKYILLFTAFLNLVFSIYLGKLYGVFGVLIATSIARILTNVWYEPYAVFKYGLNSSPSIYFKKYILYFLVTGFIFILSFYITSYIELKGIIGFFTKGMVCFIIWNIFASLIFFKTNEFKYIINLIKKSYKLTNNYKK